MKIEFNNLKTYDVKIIDFLATKNTIKITNENEYQIFSSLLKKFGLNISKRFPTFYNWISLIHQNNETFNGYICFEYDNSKGFTFYTDEKKSIDWYGIKPLTISDLDIILLNQYQLND